jgi:phosphomannomutase
VVKEGRVLRALPTRDALIVVLAVLGLARELGTRVSGLASLLPPRFTASDRLADFPTALSSARLDALRAAGPAAITAALGADLGTVTTIDDTDGLRIVFSGGDIVHLRPSGNAPELRCYTEADTADRTAALLGRCLAVLATWKG